MRPRQPRDSRFLRSAEVAASLGVTKTTLKNWLRAGKVPEPLRDPSNGYRVWSVHDVDQIRRVRRGEVIDA
jgi:DNA-binding transcriptional MerR regulator